MQETSRWFSGQGAFRVAGLVLAIMVAAVGAALASGRESDVAVLPLLFLPGLTAVAIFAVIWRAIDRARRAWWSALVIGLLSFTLTSVCVCAYVLFYINIWGE